jgi:hypothetical protein
VTVLRSLFFFAVLCEVAAVSDAAVIVTPPLADERTL